MGTMTYVCAECRLEWAVTEVPKECPECGGIDLDCVECG